MKLKVKKLGAYRGLMFRRTPKLPVLIKLDGHGIHTYFVFYPLRCAFLDKDFKIIDIRWHLRPFSRFKPHIPPAFVIESSIADYWNPVIGEKVELEVV